ncbi:low temperature requirement protein A [Deinococcus sp. YIM 134068]|uniref:low temperature requirement protein A n=1 Tax=Deinococcus lichenicola TaxID=3118910 RepID=UPI002F92E287
MTQARSPLGAARRFEVTPLELFFDLVFVFAVSQLSHHLLENLSWRGATETLVLLLAVYRTWSTTSWDAAMLGVGRPDARGLLLAVMWLGLFMNAAIPGAFGAGVWAFVLPLVVGQLGRSFWMMWRPPTALFREHFRRTSLWMVAIAPLWVVGGLVDPEARLGWWAAAALLDLIGGWLGHPVPGRRLNTERLAFDAEHMLERNRLFLLISLGETVLTTGTAIAEVPMTALTVTAGTAALAGTVALWAVLFGRTHTLTLRHLGETRDPLRMGRLATNTQVLIVVGLIALAVANERIIAHPWGPPSPALTLLLFGGPVLVRLELALYLWFLDRRIYRSHLDACAVLIVAGLLTLTAPPFVSLTLAGAVLVALALLEGP